MVKKRPWYAIVFSILLVLIAVTLFSTWGYQAVSYLLGASFNVETGSTFYDLIIGVVAMISSVLIFMGALYLWSMKVPAIKYLSLGSIGFLIKNVFDIINDIIPLTRLAEVTIEEITTTSWAIGGDLFQTVFWVFILVFFTRAFFRKKLSK